MENRQIDSIGNKDDNDNIDDEHVVKNKSTEDRNKEAYIKEIVNIVAALYLCHL